MTGRTTRLEEVGQALLPVPDPVWQAPEMRAAAAPLPAWVALPQEQVTRRAAPAATRALEAQQVPAQELVVHSTRVEPPRHRPAAMPEWAARALRTARAVEREPFGTRRTSFVPIPGRIE